MGQLITLALDLGSCGVGQPASSSLSSPPGQLEVVGARARASFLHLQYYTVDKGGGTSYSGPSVC